MSSAWRKEIWAALGWFTASVLIGLLLGHPGTALFVATLTYLGWHLGNAWRLYRWLSGSNAFEPPAGWGLWEDIQYELRRLKNRNRRSKQRLTSILGEYQASTAALPDGAVVLDRAGQIVWCNDAAIGLLGLRSPQDKGQRIVNLLRHPAFIDYMRAGSYDHSVEAPSPIDADTQLLLRVVPYGDGQRLLIARDISDLKRLDQMRRDFVANASHELRTPLTVLRGYLDAMHEDAGAQGGALRAWRKPLDDMLQQSARMEHIIGDMLTLAHLESSGPAVHTDVVDVADILHKVVRQAQSLSKDKHRIDLEVEPLRLRGRYDELHSAFSNLILNAVRHTPPGSGIRIRWRREGREAHFSVADDGPGIPAKDIPRLTERFYRVDAGRSRANGGTGLGLAIVKHALERHDARLHIDSRIDVGSTFTCIFPARRVVSTPAGGRRTG